MRSLRLPRHGHAHEHGHGGNHTGPAGPAGGAGPVDLHVVVHAVAMTAFTVVVFPWLWWTVRRGLKSDHVRAAAVAAAVFLVLLVHAFWAVDGTGDHPHLHGTLAVVVTLLVAAQIAAGLLRARAPVRAAHVWLGRFLVAVVFPFQWLTGIQTACVDTSTALAGHGSVAIFTFLFGLWLLSRREPDQNFESAVLFAGGAVGLLGDLAVTEPGFPPRRLHHLFLYLTFMAAGAASRASASSWPTVVAFFVFGVLIMAHQHGGHHTAHVGHAEMAMNSGAADLTFAMHASSGVALVVAAGGAVPGPPRPVCAGPGGVFGAVCAEPARGVRVLDDVDGGAGAVLWVRGGGGGCRPRLFVSSPCLDRLGRHQAPVRDCGQRRCRRREG